MFTAATSTAATCLQQPPVYRSHLYSSHVFTAATSTAATCLQQPPVYRSHLYSSQLYSSHLYSSHPSTAATCLQQPPVYSSHLSTVTMYHPHLLECFVNNKLLKSCERELHYSRKLAVTAIEKGVNDVVGTLQTCDAVMVAVMW